MNLYEKYYKEKAREEVLPVLEIAKHYLLNPPSNPKIFVEQQLEPLIKEIKQ